MTEQSISENSWTSSLKAVIEADIRQRNVNTKWIQVNTRQEELLIEVFEQNNVTITAAKTGQWYRFPLTY